MATQEQAEYIIRDIRRSRHADQPGGIENDANAQDLVQALSLLSDQLYNKPTHFILELAQNADGHTYPEDVHLVSASSIMKAAISIHVIGHSTKQTPPSQLKKGYIGEKGIGFKAVFKAADVVYISSGNFNFKFDKN
ncbi:hypothetical protein AC578_10548 [Pseudocercospora eumusae]|uniref:Uncharacterized protein n=1 Tax=Pseudocercospora eumusae TaxID=321146 RepID=A0A139H5V7_9PEZI|nr:hypothetical protein AC578_10548 [Pseudocercospora eumusae]